MFKDDKFKAEDLMMGRDITGPPSLPRPFLIIKGGESHVLLCSDLYDNADKDEEDFAENYIDDELNMARLNVTEKGENTAKKNPVRNVGDC